MIRNFVWILGSSFSPFSIVKPCTDKKQRNASYSRAPLAAKHRIREPPFVAAGDEAECGSTYLEYRRKSTCVIVDMISLTLMSDEGNDYPGFLFSDSVMQITTLKITLLPESVPPRTPKANK
jgi:hypothetical protein